jgi:hypothetical protein
MSSHSETISLRKKCFKETVKKCLKETLPCLTEAIEIALSDSQKWDPVEWNACQLLNDVCRIKIMSRDVYQDEAKQWSECIDLATKMVDAIRAIFPVVKMKEKLHREIAQWPVGANNHHQVADYATLAKEVELQYSETTTHVISYLSKLRTYILVPTSEYDHPVEEVHQGDSLHKLNRQNSQNEIYHLNYIRFSVFQLKSSLGKMRKFADDIINAFDRAKSPPAKLKTAKSLANPETPTKPSTSAKPGAPTKPPASVKLGTPMKPPASAKPGTPTKPSASAKPGTPTRPPASAKPGTPTKPPASVKLGTPTKPPASVKLGTPTKPPASVKPGTPTKPSALAKLGTPTKPPAKSETSTKSPARLETTKYSVRPGTSTKSSAESGNSKLWSKSENTEFCLKVLTVISDLFRTVSDAYKQAESLAALTDKVRPKDAEQEISPREWPTIEIWAKIDFVIRGSLHFLAEFQGIVEMLHQHAEVETISDEQTAQFIGRIGVLIDDIYEGIVEKLSIVYAGIKNITQKSTSSRTTINKGTK